MDNVGIMGSLKKAPRLLRLAALGMVTAFYLFLLSLCALKGPQLTARVLAPTAASECQSIRPGMTRKQVLDLFQGLVPPEFQYLDAPNSILFSRRDGACRVEFTSDPDRVNSSRFERPVIGFTP
jgi:hypothetical protein